MSYRADKQVITAHTDGRTDTQTDAGNDNTRRPKLASGKNVKIHINSMMPVAISLYTPGALPITWINSNPGMEK